MMLIYEMTQQSKIRKKPKPEQSDKLKNTFSFFRILIRKSKKPLAIYWYHFLSFFVYLYLATETFNLTISGIWQQKLTTKQSKNKNSTNFCKRTVAQPFKLCVMKTKNMFSFKFCKAFFS